MIPFIALVFVVTILLGIPIAFSLGISSFVAVIFSDLPMRMIPERMLNSVNSFPLMAIPLFMIAGELMDSSGILSRLIAFAQALVGHIRGGLAQITTLSGMILAGVSGTAVGDASALAATLIPSMKKEYGTDFAAAVVASAANIGPIIPPSAAMIVYAFMTGGAVSVAGLFLAGMVPGILIGVGMMVLSYIIARKRNYPIAHRLSFRELVYRTRKAFLILTMPIIVVGGIVWGVFTATEAAAIAVTYSVLLGFFVTRELTLKAVWRALINGTITASIVILLISLASSVTFVLTIERLPAVLTDFITSITTTPFVFISLVMILLIFVGMVLESNAAYIMLVPILSPVAISYGIDPLRFGFLFVLNLVIGHLTPPVGVVLFVTGGVANLSFERMARAILPFLLLQYAVLILCMLFPDIYMFVPRFFGY
ncbi:TRAP transporter large permease subunit [candidate division KSB3 bacterium]|uniref:TRAP transporter large permease subunit n=1 Tax=candidate division KSB3 bacterium TaxID=2044937 RepID=A0A9D5JS24_9BACT|nr:TRAP transporter large permease subunit [candidate division KSB3 bacterium]MBD3323222.1 TRAP transporter large permease subunit [candidate division KSB3 bacterium]